MIHINRIYSWHCGGTGMQTTNEKDVTCPGCLAKKAAIDAESFYRFPATKFVQENTLSEQVQHVASESKEVGGTLDDEEMPQRTAEELIDLIHSAETALRILNVDVAAIAAQVVRKNRERNYYP